MKIPKIIHQIWSDIQMPLPFVLQKLSKTWIDIHPDWEYKLWGEKEIDAFVRTEYPQYYTAFCSLPFDMQRWDTVRFLILNMYGGMHVDCDYECLENIEPLLADHTCCIALEPDKHCQMYNVPNFLNSALFASVPNHPFLQRIIEQIFSNTECSFSPQNKPMYILNTTGPLMLSHLYQTLSPEEQSEIYLIPAQYVTPFDTFQIVQVKQGIENEELEECLKDAYAVHYFSGLWT